MADYPILLKLEGRLCVVVGGGPVAIRKVMGLRETGARIRLVAAKLSVPVEQLTGVEIAVRPFREGDLEGAIIAFVATGDRSVNADIVREAHERGILVCVADTPGEGDFILPALLRRGDLTVAVATAGRSPAMAAVLRDLLAEQFGPEWEPVLGIVAALRQKWLTLQKKTEYNQAILRRLLQGGLPAMVAGGDSEAIDRLLLTLFGEGFSLAQLGIRLAKGKT